VPEDKREPTVTAGALEDAAGALRQVLARAPWPGAPQQATVDAAARDRALRTVAESLRGTGVLEVAVEPGAFRVQSQILWEPEPPLDAVPRSLHAAGVRGFVLRPGVSEDGLRRLLALLTGASAEECISELWSGAVAGVDVRADDASDDEPEAVEAERTRARAQLDAQPERAATGAPLEGVVRAVFASQLELQAAHWVERFSDAAVDALVQATMRREPAVVLGALRRASAERLRRGYVSEVVAIERALEASIAERLPAKDAPKVQATVAGAMLGAEALDAAAAAALETDGLVPDFEALVAALPPGELPRVLALLPRAAEVLRPGLLAFVGRALGGRENEVAAAALAGPLDLGCELVHRLGRAGTPAARAALGEIIACDEPLLRLEARLVSGQAADGAAELGGLVEHGTAASRAAALRTAVRHGIRALFPVVVRLAREPSFDDLDEGDRREILRALLLLSPEHGEPVVVEVLRRGGVLATGTREVSRVLAAQALGESARTVASHDALRQVEATRVGVGEGLRRAAAAAASAIAGRAGLRATRPDVGEVR
jgi:hypothetical protein